MLAASSAPLLSSRSLRSLKSLLSDAVSHSSLAWSEEFWLEKSGDLVPMAEVVGGVASGRAGSEVRCRSAAVGPPSTGMVTGVPEALERVGDRETGPGPEARTKAGREAVEVDPGPVSPPANTAASLSFSLRKRGGLSCLGGRAGRGRRGLSLSLLLWGPPSPNFFTSKGRSLSPRTGRRSEWVSRLS